MSSSQELTEAQKLISPYGVNYTSSIPFSRRLQKGGSLLFRCYAFTLDDMDKAKGADHIAIKA